MASGNKLVFANAEKARDAIVESQKKEIASLYQKWADEIGERANYYAHKSTASSVVSERQMQELKNQLRQTSQQVSNEVYGKVKESMYMVADAVVKDNVEWLKQFGFSEEGLNAAFSSVPDQIVRRIVTGQIYEGGWNLSSRIWSNNEATLKKAYEIVAKGVAENRPIYDIAKELQGYVQPDAAKPWNPLIRMKNTKTGEYEWKRIYRGKVDYNAQRLARTLVQHSYQQSFIAVTEKNPFVLKYVWYANGSRPCPLCQDRDGQEFEKGDLPMDHPNGMCTMAPVIDDNMLDKLADWFNSPDGTYPDIDQFAGQFGYKPNGQKPDAGQSAGKFTREWLEKNGISKNMINGLNLSDEDRKAIIDRLAADGVSEEYRAAFGKAQKGIHQYTTDDSMGSYYCQFSRKKEINIAEAFGSTLKSENPYNTLFHEIGHAIDDLVSGGPDTHYSGLTKYGFSQAMMTDLDNLAAGLKSGTGSITMRDLYALYGQQGTSGVQDILGAAKYISAKKYGDIGSVRYKWGHSESYWKRGSTKKEAASELFAHISAAQVSDQEMAVMKQYFPNSVDKFTEIVAQVASKVK